MAKRRRLDPAPAPTPGHDSASGLSAPFSTRPPIADMAGDASTTAALQEVSAALQTARTEGLLIQRLPLDAIDPGYLVRDRIAHDATEMQALIASLRDRGQQTAIEVADLGAEATPRYGLISGWRRLNALRKLAKDGGTDTVLAIARPPGEAGAAYRAMVEENEIRVGLSYYERARIAAQAADRGVFPDDRAALSALFAAASRPRRSKIGSFIRIHRALDGDLHFPASLGERLGLALAKGLEAQPGLTKRLKQTLKSNPPATAEAEASLLTEALKAQPRTRKSARNREDDIVVGDMRISQSGSTITLDGTATRHPGFASALADFLSRKDWENS